MGRNFRGGDFRGGDFIVLRRVIRLESVLILLVRIRRRGISCLLSNIPVTTQ